MWRITVDTDSTGNYDEDEFASLEEGLEWLESFLEDWLDNPDTAKVTIVTEDTEP